MIVQAGHYILLVTIFLLLGWGINQAVERATTDVKQRERFVRGYFAFAGLWIAYVSILAGTGFLADFSLPPKMVVFVIIPAFFIIGWFFTAKKIKPVIQAFPESFTVYFQSFRIIVELLIWGAVLNGLGPELLTFEGRNFDILAGITAPIVGYMAYNKQLLSPKILLMWNIVCLGLLANIVFIFMSLAVKPEIWGYVSVPISLDFPRLPYIYIAGMFMPMAVFMHILSIRKILNRIKADAVVRAK